MWFPASHPLPCILSLPPVPYSVPAVVVGVASWVSCSGWCWPTVILKGGKCGKV